MFFVDDSPKKMGQAMVIFTGDQLGRLEQGQEGNTHIKWVIKKGKKDSWGIFGGVASVDRSRQIIYILYTPMNIPRYNHSYTYTNNPWDDCIFPYIKNH